VHRVEANINRDVGARREGCDCAFRFALQEQTGIGGSQPFGQSVDMAVEERDTVALFRGCGKVQSRNN